MPIPQETVDASAEANARRRPILKDTWPPFGLVMDRDCLLASKPGTNNEKPRVNGSLLSRLPRSAISLGNRCSIRLSYGDTPLQLFTRIGAQHNDQRLCRGEKGCRLQRPCSYIAPMVRSQAPVPEAIKHSIACGRYSEAAGALRDLVRQEPSVAILVALADMNLQLGHLTEAKENALRAVETDSREHAARVLLARVRTALDERAAALADFRAALELARPRMAPAGDGPIAVPAHQALHNLEQLIYLEQADGLQPGALLPVD